MRSHSRILLVWAIAVWSFAMLSPTDAQTGDPVGTWLTEDKEAIVRIAACGNELCGHVVWLKTPIDPQTGLPPTDELNVDPAKKGRSILGMPVVSGMKAAGVHRCDGRVYNVDDGKEYDGNLIMNGATELRIQGCVLFVCEGQTLARQELPPAAVSAQPVQPHRAPIRLQRAR